MKPRQVQILSIVREAGYSEVIDLAITLGVHKSTIRRDLAELEAQGQLERSHGGVAPAERNGRQDIAFSVKERTYRPEKSAIGAAMAERIGDGQTVLLDSGSTTLEVARHLEGHSGLTVITNDLRIGVEIASHHDTHLVVLGGELLHNVYTLWGDEVIDQLKKLKVDVAVFGADAVNSRSITNTNSYEVEMKRTMHSIATTSFLVADSSKFERQAPFHIMELTSFITCVTDERVDPIIASSYPIPIIRVSAKRR